MKKYFDFPFFILLLIKTTHILAQTEFVPNGGFEIFSVCPVGFSEFEGKVAAWENPNTASPDYMDECANPFPAGVPENGIGWQMTHSGNGYAGMYAFGGTLYREFIQAQLTTPLTAGQTYIFQMYVVLHNKSNTAIDDIGVYISVSAPSATGTGLLSGTPLPQISNPAGAVLTDTLNWTLISGTYTASGGEQYITIGHLQSDAATTYLTLPSGTVGAYYYYDDISLTEAGVLPVTLQSFEGNMINEGKNNIVQLRWSTATEINNCCFYVERSTDGVNFSDVGKVTGAGNSTSVLNYTFTDVHILALQYYRLRQQDVDGSSALSDVISVRNVAALISVSQSINDHTLLVYNDSGQALIASLYNITGEEEAEQVINEGTTNFDLPDMLHGIYILQITDKHTGAMVFSDKIFL